MQSDLLSRLKNETAACHARLENALDLMRDDLQRDEYIALLERFYGYVAPWEDAAAACLPATLSVFFDQRRKAPLLAADLAALTGERRPVGSVPQADTRYDLPRLHNLGDAFGSMYVMEGSTLGGRFIAPHVAQRLDLASGLGNAYFEGYGARTGSMWNAFRETAAASVPEAQHDDAVKAAIATFESLQSWLCPEAAGVDVVPPVPGAVT
ncbi:MULTISPECIES: biliverdin-producing heme oxygenase [unclassified Caballeronia]|uniref:biliverdin-producing heme oxygenase n=1 Tax=unclassified Caballeronia TaxID=2646786 RepID=UPI00285EA451|nr:MULTISPECIES: biliverdin-producing heme oxygenase [unclassified Caballeronia]MDR5813589.1 biliverdin-producing heme oxygenase [Caballeronia sp. LZ033]MDR5820346.1 biliverdin-producing heme oxygenase [Caballeronia sp. LZ043]MDR5878163.1 biliverdin-producing heme oxygenase [Caballeronia sp. LZ032]